MSIHETFSIWVNNFSEKIVQIKIRLNDQCHSPYKYKSVDIPDDVNDALAIAVGDWVLSEDQEVTKHHQVCCD